MGIFFKLFAHKDPYDISGTEDCFYSATKKIVEYHAKNCLEYRKILDASGFEMAQLNSIEDIHKIPPLTSLYFKRNNIYSITDNKIVLKAESSGTKGSKSHIAFDKKTLKYGITMMIRFFSYQKIISIKPVRYIFLGYSPKENPDLGAAKTAYHTSKFAPSLSKTFAIKKTENGYKPNAEEILRILNDHPKGRFRFVGFPYMMYFLTKELKDRNLRFNLHKGSKILLGGGWKGFESVPESEFYELLGDTLGIGRENITEFFSAVEHPLPYVKCKCGNFHVPIYSRVIIRDAFTLEPKKDGEPGILGFVSPLVWSMPLVSVMTDDIAVSGQGCPCGNSAPYFTLLGRAGVSGIKTCAAQIVRE